MPATQWLEFLDAAQVAIAAVDAAGTVVEGTAAAAMLGLGAGRSLGAWLAEHGSPTDDTWGAAALQPATETSKNVGLANGRILRLTIRPASGEAGLLLLLLTDVTAEVAAEQALADARARLDEAEQVAHLGSFTWDPRHGAVHWSEEMLRVFGYDPVETPWAAGSTAAAAFSDRIHPDDRSVVFADWQAAAAGAAGVSSYRIIRPDGEVRWLVGRTHPVVDVDGRLLRVVGTVQDVTEEHQAAEVLERLALHDALTGLPNRVLFMDRLSHALDRRAAPHRRVAVLFCDVDHFKWVNDSLGHEAGDRLLSELGRRLSGVVRPGDTVARLGGDEFAVLCEDMESELAAASLAERVRGVVALPFDVGGAELQPTVSIGIAVAAPHSRNDPDSVLREADAAMYRAKERGRDRVESFDDAMRVRALLRVRTEAELRRGLERDEVVAWYQPHVELATGAVAGTEALARWCHPQRRVVLPDEFIGVAEETGLILGLGRAVLNRAVRDTAAWNRTLGSELTVAVNLSARQLLSPDLAANVRTALVDSGLDPSLLCLEITESVLLSDAEQSSLALAALRDLGVRIAVDDFGTGYSSLTYLRRFPVDVLKIDRSFVAGIDVDRVDRSIVAATIVLARDLGLVTVAEGVETEAQASYLDTMGCDYGQGNLWSAARAADDVAPLLRADAWKRA